MTQLSIIVPVYNKEQYIDFCIESILGQTHRDFELILVNDGSTDNSGSRCDSYQKRDSRIRVIHQKNGGVSSARNSGLEICRGEYIGFVDSDDILDADMYEILMDNAKKHSADISMCGVRRVFPHKVQLHGNQGILKMFDTKEGISGLLKGDILMSNYDKIYKRQPLGHLRFDPAFTMFEDTYYNFNALKISTLSVYDDRIRYNYMIRDSSHSMSAFNQKYMNTLILTKKMLDICHAELPAHIDEAKAFNFNTNMVMLNMLLIDSKGNHKQDFKIISDNLKSHAGEYKKLKHIPGRYRWGYFIFSLSAALYASILQLYSRLTNSEHLNRKQKSEKPAQLKLQ